MRKFNRFKSNRLLALLTATATSSLIANPQTPVVVNGQATFSQVGNALTVTNSPGAIINWQQFNINRGELTRFVQESASSQVLNRVTGLDPSVILGSLQSNGRVFLVNPNGIVFGAGAQVDVAGLVASTLRLSDSDFMSNRLRFTQTPDAGGVSNAGTIKSALGGEILLVAPRVENSGLIQAPEGKILLAAGRSVEVADIDRPNIRVEIANTDEQAVNLGTLLARSISIYGGLVRNSGHIQASTAVVGENGKVTLRAAQRVVLEPTSVIEATGSRGTTGGEINITAQNTVGQANGGEVLVQGVVAAQPVMDVRGVVSLPNTAVAPAVTARAAIDTVANITSPTDSLAPPVPTAATAQGGNAVLDISSAGVQVTTPVFMPTPATPSEPARPAPLTPALPVSPGTPIGPSGGYGMGGSVRISAGGRVAVGDGARIDTSGTYGGGEILVGGGWQGLNPNLINSQFTYIAKTATLHSNAHLRGNGGLVVVWANDTSRVYGNIAARGGALAGDGGAIETSGKRFLEVTRSADASASQGKAGQWLLDPNNVTIQSTGTDTNISTGPAFASTADSSIITVATIQAALNSGTNVTVSTSVGGAQQGDITLTNALAIMLNGNSDVTLTLNAHNNINLNAGISATGTGTGKLNLVLNANIAAGAGAAKLNSIAGLALKGGGISSTNGTVLNIASGTLNKVTLATDAVVSGTTYLENGLTLSNSKISIGNGVELRYTGSQTLGGTGTVEFAGASSYLVRQTANTVLTVDAGITVNSAGSSGSAYFGYYGDETIAFAGTLNANNAGKTWYLGGFSNTGNINVSAGNVHLDAQGGSGTWINTSATGKGIAVSGGNLVLGDAFNATGMGAIAVSAGNVVLNGTLTLNQPVTNLSTVGLKSLAMNSATINGAGNQLTADTGFVLSSSTSTLNQLVLAADLQATGNTTIIGGLTLVNSTVKVTNTSLVYNGTQTIGGTGQIIFAGNSTSVLNRFAPGAALTVGSGVTVGSEGTSGSIYFGYYADEVINFTGTLNASNANKTWNLGGVRNTGTIHVSAGTVNMDTVSGDGTWTNTGDAGKGFNLSGTGVLNLGDVFSTTDVGRITRSGGAVNITGRLNLGGTGTVDIGGAGVFGAGGLSLLAPSGSINNGTLVSTDGTVFKSAGGTLSNMLIGSNLTTDNGTLSVGGNLTLGSGVTVNKGSSVWNWTTAGGQTLGVASGTATVNSTGGYVVYNGSYLAHTANLGPGLAVQGTWAIYSFGDSVVNNSATLIATTANSSIQAPTLNNLAAGGVSTTGAATLTASGTAFNNAGNLTAGGGVVTLSSASTLNSGILRVLSGGSMATTSSTFNSAGSGIDLQSGGVFNLGGTFSITGGLSIVAGATVNLKSGITVAEFASLNFSGGTAVLNSVLNNTGNTLTLAGAGGRLRLGNSGVISGGTVTSSGAVTLTSTGGSLSGGVTLATDMTVENGGVLTINGGLVLSGGKRLVVDSSGADTYLYINGAGTQTITGTGSIEFTGVGTGVSNRNVTYNGVAPSLLLDTGITVTANAGGNFWNIASGLTLNGAFNVNSASTLSMNVSQLTRGAGSTFNIQSGTLRLNGATSDYTGTWHIQSGATLDLNHTVARTLGAGFIATGAGRIANESSTLTVNGMANTTAGFAQLGSGVTTFSTAMNMGSLDIVGGTVSGSVALNVSGNFTMTGGTLGNTGATSIGGAASSWSSGTVNAGTLNNSGTLQIGGSGYSILTGASAILNNTGTIVSNKTSLNWRVEAGATLNNLATGVIDLQTAPNFESLSGTGNLNNDGILRKTSGTATTISGIVVDNRTNAKIDVQAGTLTVGTLLSGTNAGILNLESGAAFSYSGVLTNAGTLSGSGALNLGSNTLTNIGTIAPGTATDPTGTLTITGNLILGSTGTVQAQLDGTALGNYDTLAVSGNVNYGGTLTLNGTATAGNFSLLTSATRTLNSTFATVSGSIAAAAPVYSGTGLTIGLSAAGQWTGLGDGFTWGSTLNWGGGVLPGAADDVVIASAGNTLVVGSGSFGVKSLTLGSGRSLQVAGGTLVVGSASTLGAGLTLDSGSLTLNGATTVTGAYSQSGGTLTGTGSLVLNGGGTWSGGTLDGGISINNVAGQIFNMVGTGTLGFGTVTFNNNGTLNWSGGNVDIVGNGTLNNTSAALLDITSDSVFGDYGVGVGTLTLNNQNGATLRKSAGTGVSSIGGSGGATPNGVNFNNAGSVEVQTGTLSFNHAWVASPLPSGAGTSAGAFSVAGGATLRMGGNQTLTSAASVSGAGAVLLDYGSFTSSATWSHSGALNVAGGSAHFVNNVTLGSTSLTSGSLQFSGVSNVVANLTTSAGTTLTLNGTTSVSGAASLYGTQLNGSGSLSLNSASNFSGITLNTDVHVGNGIGLVVANGLTFQSGRAIYLDPTSVLTTLELAGQQTIGGNGHIVFNGVDGNHRIYTNVSNGGSGIILGSGVIVDVNGSGRIDGAGAFAQVLTNGGTINVAAGKTLRLETIASLTNAGTINSSGTLSVDPSLLGSGNCCNFSNTGQVNILAGNASILGNGTDTGIYSVVTGGTLNFQGAGTRTWSGTYKLAGGTLAFSNQSVELLGTLSGVGTFANNGSGAFTNNGTISPGSAADTTGTLNITGNLVMGVNSVLNMELNTTTPGDHDVLAVTGQMTYGGGLQLSGAGSKGGYAIVTSASSSGAFASVTGIASASPVYSGSGLTLNIAVLLGQWLGTADSNWGNSLNWSGGTLPGINDDVNLTGVGSAITLTSGNFTIKSLTTGAGSSLQLNGGGLTITGVSNVAGGLNVAAGTHTFGGPSVFNGTTQLSGGDLIANRNLNIQNAFAWTGGTISGTGVLTTSGTSSVSAGALNAKVWNNTGNLLKVGAGVFDVANGTASVFNNNGTVSVNAGEFKLGTATGSDTGTYTVDSGATLRFSSDHNFAATSSFNGSGTVIFNGGSQSLASGVQINTAASLDDSMLSLQDVAINKTFTYVGGSIAIESGKTLTVNTGGVLHISTGKTLSLAAGEIAISGGALTGGSGSRLNLSSTLRNVGTLNLNSLVTLIGAGTLVNDGTLSGSNYTLPLALTNNALGTLNLTDGGVSGSFINYGNFNVGGAVLLSGAIADQLGGKITIPSGATLQRNTGALRWVDGTLSGTGAVDATGGSFLFSGTGNRVIDGLNFTFDNLTLPDGSLTVKSGSLTLTGTATLPAGVALNLDGGTFTNNAALTISGAFNLVGGTFGGSGGLNMTGGSLNLPSTNAVVWNNNGALNNTGTLNFANGTITNAITNTGTINVGSGVTFKQAFVNNGTLVFGIGSGTTAFTGGLVQNGGASISTQLNGGTLQGNFNIDGGTVSGSGTVGGDVTFVSGTLAPGFSPGAITVIGNLNLNAASVLTVELGGLTQSTGYDFINVQGTANLAGTLNVTSFNGFVAPASSSYTFMKFAAATGSFATVNLPSGWNLAYQTALTNLSVIAPAAAVPVPVPVVSSVTLAALGVAPNLAPHAAVLTLERVDTAVAPLQAFSAPDQKLVSVEKPIAEEVCQ